MYEIDLLSLRPFKVTNTRSPSSIGAPIEASKFASLFTFMDHWFQLEGLGGKQLPMLEGYTSLGYVAALTSRIRLGLLVTGVTYRYPGLHAKAVTALDVLSGGRATLGIGAAWYDAEHAGLGVPFPPVSERFERLEETLQIVKQIIS